MKKIISILSLCFLVGGYSSSAQAIIIEPFVGFSLSGSCDNNGCDDASWTNYGLRLGMTTLGFMYGVEYGLGSESFDPGSTDLSTTDLGVFVGYEFPILLRAYLTYFLSSESKADGNGGTYTGTGTRIGVGYTGLPFVALNLEMVTKSFDERELNGATTSTNAGTSYTMISVSVPLP